MKVAEVCGAAQRRPEQELHKWDLRFGKDWCREQYNTNKILLDAVSQVVVGMTHSDFVKEAVKRLPAAQEEFGDLYNTQMLELELKNGKQ